MSVTFQCKVTGNYVVFKDAVDIDSMRKHPEYIEVVAQEEQPKPATSSKRPTKKDMIDNEEDSI